MQVPMYVLAIAYFLLFLVWVILTLVNIYHVLRYAYWSKVPVIVAGFYLLFAVGIIAATGILVRNVDWTSSIDLNVSTPEIKVPNPFSQTNANFNVLK